jgi:hypothetical protein
MEEEYKIIDSPLSREYTAEGHSVDVQIYSDEDQKEWILEVVNEAGTSILWDDPFDSDEKALEAFIQTVEKEGIQAFLEPES